MDFKNKMVVITGGSIGIGLHVAKTLIAEGAHVLVCARNLPALEIAKSENPSIEIVQCDITQKDEVLFLLERSRDLLGGVDVLINNAALFGLFSVRGRDSLESQLNMIEVNLSGTIQVTDIFLKTLLESPSPVIVNLTSALGFVPVAYAPVYSATKAAINSWTLSLRHQLRETPCSVVLLSPPVVDTRMNQNNPTSEGMEKVSPEKFAAFTVSQLKKDKKEILYKPIDSLKLLSRFMPRQAFKMLNKHTM